MDRVFPRGAAWLSAFALAVFTGLLVTTMSWFYRAAFVVWTDTPRIGALLAFVGFVSPIGVVAISNHGLHIALDKLAKRRGSRGLVPGLMSWWAGLYAWLVLVLSTVSAVSLMLVIYPSASFYGFANLFRLDSGLTSILSIPTILFIGIAAFMFQLERRVRAKLSEGPDSTI
jgi:hypothetical protein